MTGTHTQNPIYSRITMALMEDTGWYMPNYELADELKWGSQLGKLSKLGSHSQHNTKVLNAKCSS